MRELTSAQRILLIRHGETDWNRDQRFQGKTDVPLNRKGREQAHALALALKEEPLTVIYSSPLARAMETARIIKIFHPSVPLLEEKGLIEMDLGHFEGMEAHRWAIAYPDFRKRWRENPSSVKMPAGESLQEVQGRAIDTLERMTQECPPESTLVLCSHNFVICTILCRALSIPLDDFRTVRQEIGAINILCKRGGQLWAKVVNERSHLEKYRREDI
jgi:broad specificity phosphatase PhoE